MPQNHAFYALRDVLADLYPNEVDGQRVAAEAGLTITRIAFSAQAVQNWTNILTYALNQESLADVVEIAQREYGKSQKLGSAWSAYQQAHGQESAATQTGPVKSTLTATERTHLQTQLVEQRSRYDTATKFIELIDKEIKLTLDLDRKFVLEEMRKDRVAERDAAFAEMTRIEALLNG